MSRSQLDPFIPQSMEVPAERTRVELIVKTLALHLAVISSAGHLTSLQNQSRRHSRATLWQLAWLIAVPTYPIATLVDRSIRCARMMRKEGRQSVSLGYCLGAVSGMHAEKRLVVAGGEEHVESVPLIEVRVGDVRSIRQARDWVWIGRMVILLALMTQSVATLVLSGRRLNAEQLCEIDIRNAMMALGGLFVQLISAFILLRNERWEFIPGIEHAGPSIGISHGEDLGIVATVLITLSTMVNSWYFRFHMKDTYAQVLKKGDEQLYTFPRGLRALDFGTEQRAPYLRLYHGRTNLPNFYWLIWPLLLYPAHQTGHLLALLISTFLSSSFVVEELVSRTFSTWKDPIAEKLYVF
ncbi:hypothetical protein K458DRAFT_397146 [Lentithecium fluviatile CBS 122367]|uniref:Uncharacterized protein n=1 Tax=Lentithecium fluviatile CBS 122367 TaxID=1168545 RepID=A0A6G1IED1_9PLEO|nr:hypothetical protein K458DRAFT_397146 [Lentithecium fluviatile CBS 122367]